MSWQADVLGAGYEQQLLELGPDPDGEGEAAAVLVRRTPREAVGGVVLYVHGFADYFFQTELSAVSPSTPWTCASPAGPGAPTRPRTTSPTSPCTTSSWSARSPS